jgi:ADP-heptose:LPS heptosyltransferase
LTPPKHILVIRFSSLGDVAMTVPVLKNLLHQFPGVQVTVISQPFFAPLFTDIERLHFYSADVKIKFKGLVGLVRLSRKIRKDISHDAIADLHDSLRSRLLRWLLPGTNAVIDKGRKEKKEMTKRKNKKLRQLKTTFHRYAEVFEKLGLPVNLDISTGIRKIIPRRELVSFLIDKSPLIGIAPFAKHEPKQYPISEMEKVVKKISSTGAGILLFGSREESLILDKWANEKQGVYSLAGKLFFEDELNVISQLKLMISMDSANMHLASLFGIPVISIWGGTHPFSGFYGWGQSMDNAIQSDLPCRPSSVFGNKPCPVHRNSGCMGGITPEMIIERVENVLVNSKFSTL